MMPHSNHPGRTLSVNRAASRLVRPLILLLLLVYPVQGRTADGLQTLGICVVDWPPYTSRHMADSGPLVEFITAVLNDMGYDPQFVFMSTLACEDQVAENETNAGIRVALGYLKNQARQDKGLLFSNPVFDIEEVVFYNTNRDAQPINIESVEALANYKAAFVKGYAHTPKIQKVYAAVKDNPKKIEEPKTEAKAFARLISRDVDWVPADLAVGTYLLNNEFPGWRDVIGVMKQIPDNERPVHLMVSDRNPQNREFLNALDKSLERMKASGDFIHRLEKLQEKKLPVVRIEDPSNPFAFGMKKGAGAEERGFLLPRGTMAEVVQWPQAILKDHSLRLNPSEFVGHWAVVRILNGPHKGRVLRVQVQYIVLAGQNSR
jgi:hypothetical protein